MWAREASPHVDHTPLEREAGRPAEYAYRAGWSWVLAMAGDEDAARAQVEWVAHDGFSRLRDDMNQLAALAELTQAMALLDDPAHAAGVLQRLEPYADRNIVNGRGASGYGSAAHHVAVLKALLGTATDDDFGGRSRPTTRSAAARGSRAPSSATRSGWAAARGRRSWPARPTTRPASWGSPRSRTAPRSYYTRAPRSAGSTCSP